MAGDLSWMEERYSHLEEQSLLWEPPTLEGANQPRCMMDGKPTIMLSANNYLNLTTHPKVVEASIAAIRKYGCLLYTSPSPRDVEESRMPSSA